MESSVLPTEEPDILPWHEALCATCAPTVLMGCSKTFNNLSSKITLPGSVCLPQSLSLVLLCSAFALSLLRDTPPNPFFSTRTDALLCLRGRTKRFTMPEDEPAFLICSLVQTGAGSEHSWQVLPGLRDRNSSRWCLLVSCWPGTSPVGSVHGVLPVSSWHFLCCGCWAGVPADVSPSPTPPWGQCHLGGCSAFSQALLTPFSVLCWHGGCDKDWECGTLEPAPRRILGSGPGQSWLGGLARGRRGSSERCGALCHPKQQ